MERSLSRLSSYIENENVEVHLCILSLTNRTEGITTFEHCGEESVERQSQRDFAVFGITAIIIQNSFRLAPRGSLGTSRECFLLLSLAAERVPFRLRCTPDAMPSCILSSVKYTSRGT